jgi:hypothetical protein
VAEALLSRTGLAAYARHPLLRAVSLDRAFSRLLAPDEYAALAAQVPHDFRFVVKAPALLTDAQRRDAGTAAPLGDNPGFLDAELTRLGHPRFVQHCAQVTDSLLMAREQYPGKSNSLDALCRRLEVDNSGRDLHGALIDADLLAQVYLAMTRGQDSLVIDAGERASAPGGAGSQDAASDLSAFALPLLAASAAEREAHDVLLRGLDKVCKKGAVWRPAEAPAAVV